MFLWTVCVHFNSPMNIVYTLRVGGFCILDLNLQVGTVLGVHGSGLENFV